MKITLYKNCIFTRSYSEVCDCRIKDTNGKTARDRYLEGLTKEVFEIDSVYSTNSGTINVPIQFPNSTDSVYDFNYLKIEFESITRYCFIDDIQFMNYIAVIYYSEDIWHSYFSDMTLRIGWLSNSTYTHFGDRRFPVYRNIAPQDGLGELQVVSIENITGYVVVAQAQKSTLVREGEENELSTDIVVIQADGLIKRPWSLALRLVNELVQSQSRITTQSDSKKTTCMFDNFMILPSYMFDETLVGDKFYEVQNTSGPVSTTLTIAKALKINITDEIKYIQSITPNNSKIIRSIGLFSTDYDFVVQTNTSLTNNKIKIGVFVSQTDYRIILNFQGKVIDITDSFFYEVPITTLNAPELQQAKISRVLKNVSGATQLVGSAVGYTTAGISYQTATKLASTKIHASKYTASGNLRKRITIRDTLRGAEGEAELGTARKDLVSNIAGNSGSVINGISNLIEANANIFQSTTGTFAQNTNILNCKYGIVYKAYTNLKNSIVEETDKNVGCEINDYVSDWFFTIKGDRDIYVDTGSNAVKFGWLNIYGKFPQTVCETLKQILITGTKIWYDESSI